MDLNNNISQQISPSKNNQTLVNVNNTEKMHNIVVHQLLLCKSVNSSNITEFHFTAIKNNEKKLLDFDDLNNTYPEWKMIKILQELLMGFHFTYSENFLTEFLIRDMYQILEELKLKTSPYDKGNLTANTQYIKKPIDYYIKESKEYLLRTLMHIGNIHDKLAIDKNDLKKGDFKQITILYDKIKENLKILWLIIDNTKCPSDYENSLKKYIKYIKILNTTFENKESIDKYLPWLYKNINNTSIFIKLNDFNLKSCANCFDLLVQNKKFAKQSIRDYISLYAEIVDNIKNDKKNLKKISKNKTKILQVQEFTKSLETLTSLLNERSLLSLNILQFTSQDFCQKLYSFFNEGTEINSGFFPIEKINELQLISKNFESEMEKIISCLVKNVIEDIDQHSNISKGKKLTCSGKIEDEFSKIQNFLNTIGKEKLPEKLKKNFIKLEDMLSLFPVYNKSPLNPSLELINSICRSVSEIVIMAKAANKFGLKIGSKEKILNNNGTTIFIEIFDSLKQIKQDAFKFKQLNLTEIFKDIEYNFEKIIMANNSSNISVSFRNWMTESLETQIEEVKDIAKIFIKIDLSMMRRLIDIAKELTIYKNYIEEFNSYALAFLIHRPTIAFLSKEEETLKEKFFLEATQKLKTHSVEKLKDLSENEFEEDCLQSYITPYIHLFTKINKIVNSLKDLIISQEGEKWVVNETNRVKIKTALHQLKFFRDKLIKHSQAINFDSIYIENKENEKAILEKLEECDLFIEKFIHDFQWFSEVSLPILQKWFEKRESEKKTAIKPIQGYSPPKHKSKKQNSSKIESKDSEQVSRKKIPENVVNSNKDKKLSEKIPEKKQDNFSEAIAENENENVSEGSPQEVKIIKSKKEKSFDSSFKTVHYKKNNKVKKNRELPYWESVALQIENIYEQFSFYQIFSEDSKNLFWRCFEFENSQRNIHLNLELLKELALVSKDKLSKIAIWVKPQRWSVITDCFLRAMITTNPMCLRDNKDFNLYTHNGCKHYGILNPNVDNKEIPEEVSTTAAYLNLSYVGKMPELSTFTGEEKELLSCRIKLLEDGIENQKNTKEKIVPKPEIEKIKNRVMIFMNRNLSITLPKRQLFSIEEFFLRKNDILLWLEEQKGEEYPLLFAKNRIEEALGQCQELLENSDELKKSSPVLYCTMVSDLTNTLMSNILHLCLAKHDLLKGEIGNRPMIHCHHPWKLWNIIVKNKIFEDKPEISRVMERCSGDSRYPYAKKQSIENSLVEVYEIHTSLESSKMFQKQSKRIQNIMSTHDEKGIEELESVVDTFEVDLRKCLNVIEFIIKI